MSDKSENQIENWLEKLERESWQLELLVSAFTIFLLIGAYSEFTEFLTEATFKVSVEGPIVFIFLFLALLNGSIFILIICLVIHLLLRGFWIGTIGLRSVQSTIDFEQLNYNAFFTEKLKKKVMSLDKLVIILDEICSVIFAFSFLLISILVAFGLFFVFIGLCAVSISTILEFIPKGIFSRIFMVFFIVIFAVTILFALIFMIDYFTLGFFKKIKWFARVYYPFYRLFNFVTLSSLSRSIYYYLISKFSKKRIRIIYALVGFSIVLRILLSFDQYQYFPNHSDAKVIGVDFYDDQRPSDQYVSSVSIESRFVDRKYFPVFLRYDPDDNDLIRSQCPDFEPMIDNGLNFNYSFKTEEGGFQITGVDYTNENAEQLLSCQSAIYKIQVNDSVYSDLTYHFYIHPAKNQKGLLTTIPTGAFLEGENELTVKKIENDSISTFGDFVNIPFWYSSD